MIIPLFAQTDATAIATGASTAFAVVASIVITIATFFIIVRLSKHAVGRIDRDDIGFGASDHDHDH
ncbi:MAG TPA: hypothetical protein VIK59_02970 [Verrucomicrobiae bacterium]